MMRKKAEIKSCEGSYANVAEYLWSSCERLLWELASGSFELSVQK